MDSFVYLRTEKAWLNYKKKGHGGQCVHAEQITMG
jgi:hypothetical protein